MKDLKTYPMRLFNLKNDVQSTPRKGGEGSMAAAPRVEAGAQSISFFAAHGSHGVGSRRKNGNLFLVEAANCSS